MGSARAGAADHQPCSFHRHGHANHPRQRPPRDRRPVRPVVRFLAARTATQPFRSRTSVSSAAHTTVSLQPDSVSADVAIVGAGAAGLAAAIFIRRAHPACSVVLLEGARKPGAKILISGGARCNVTNRAVTERDFWGGPRPLIRRVLRAFTADDAAGFFHALGVPLHEEAGGKLFPDSHRSRDVLDALVGGVSA